MTTVNIDINVKDIMLTNVKCLHPKDKLTTLKAVFDEYDIHHVPVAVMGDIKGIISKGDLLFLEGDVTHSFDRFLTMKKYETAIVEDIMTVNPFTIEEDRPISAALDLMLAHRINCLPVTKDGSMVGMLTSKDMMDYLLNLLRNND